MSRDLAYADQAAADVHAVSAANVAHLSSLYAMPVSVRRENLLAIARAVHDCPSWSAKPDSKAAVKVIVRYYSLTADPMPAWGRLMLAVRDADSDGVTRALDRLTGGAS